MLRAALIFAVLIFPLVSGYGQGVGEGHTLSVYSRGKQFIDPEIYRPSDNYCAILTGGPWQEINGVRAGTVTSSGAHHYAELEFVATGSYIWQSGFRRIVNDKNGIEYSYIEGSYRFDAENRLLYLTWESGQSVYTVEYLTAATEGRIPYREVLILTGTGDADTRDPESITFIR